MGQIVSYIRVSTGKQSKSGLGIEAQREAIARFAAHCAFEVRRLTAFVLICSAALTPNLADCSRENARAAIRVPTEFANPVTCLMQSQAFLAETSAGQELDDDDRVKIVCARREPASAIK
jgi:hypothetical protein